MKLFVRITLVALSLFSVPVFAEAAQQPASKEAPKETLTVKAGNVKTLQVPGLTRLALGNVEFADVSTVDEVVRIEGLKAGETVLLVWAGSARKEYRIVVTN
jgi:Pilus formation protein N terminal region